MARVVAGGREWEREREREREREGVSRRTPYRKNSMYVHRNAAVQEVLDMAGGEGEGLACRHRRLVYATVGLSAVSH